MAMLRSYNLAHSSSTSPERLDRVVEGLARRKMEGWWAWLGASDIEMFGGDMSDASTEVMPTHDQMAVIARLQLARIDALLRAIWYLWRSR